MFTACVERQDRLNKQQQQQQKHRIFGLIILLDAVCCQVLINTPSEISWSGEENTAASEQLASFTMGCIG